MEKQTSLDEVDDIDVLKVELAQNLSDMREQCAVLIDSGAKGFGEAGIQFVDWLEAAFEAGDVKSILNWYTQQNRTVWGKTYDLVGRYLNVCDLEK